MFYNYEKIMTFIVRCLMLYVNAKDEIFITIQVSEKSFGCLEIFGSAESSKLEIAAVVVVLSIGSIATIGYFLFGKAKGKNPARLFLTSFLVYIPVILLAITLTGVFSLAKTDTANFFGISFIPGWLVGYVNRADNCCRCYPVCFYHKNDRENKKGRDQVHQLAFILDMGNQLLCWRSSAFSHSALYTFHFSWINFPGDRSCYPLARNTDFQT